jgi:hypothetical protein
MITEQDLSEAQLKVIEAIQNGKRFVASGTGTGKTIASLYALPDVKTILVVTPKILRDLGTWHEDLKKVTRDIQITHISKEDLKKECETLPVFDAIVFDEACKWLTSGVRPEQRVSKHIPYLDVSETYRCAYEYLQRTQPKYVLLIDATPLANKPLAVWAAMDILGLLTSERIVSHTWFVSKFYTPLKKGYATFWKEKTITSRHCSKADTEQAQKDILYLWHKIAVFVDDDAKIPPIEEDIFVPLTPELKAILDEVAGEYAGNPSLNGRLFGAQNSHRSFIDFNDVEHIMSIEREQIVSSKLDAVVKLLNEKKPQHGALIFSTFTEQQKAIIETLQATGRIVGHINGGTKSKDRKAILDAFNDNEIDVLVVQSGICEGYNTPSCDMLIRLSPPIRAASLEQQYGRINRKSNYKQNYIYNIVLKGNSKYKIDEEAWQRVKAGEDLSDMAYEAE